LTDLVLFGAGLPQLVGLSGRSKSYAERLFTFSEAGPLAWTDAKLALQAPTLDEGVEFTEPALRRIFDLTEGYPYFLQEWGYHAWLTAPGSPIDREAVEAAPPRAVAALDQFMRRIMPGDAA
jgi:hypothetical protein